MKSNREEALKWWNELTIPRQVDILITYGNGTVTNYLTRFVTSLTGREIEALYNKINER